MTEEHRSWQQCDGKLFWREIACNDHVVQIYRTDDVLLCSLEAYATDASDQGDSVIMIATDPHLKALSKRLTRQGYNLDRLIAEKQYIPLDAGETLARFMINGKPSEKYFMETISTIVDSARKDGKNIRAFGEMVVLLWQKDNYSATIQLEELWNKFCAMEAISLYCAYPESEFENDAGAAVMHVCTAHSKLIRLDSCASSELQYQEVVASSTRNHSSH